MNRGKILTGFMVVAFVGLGLTVLMAANTRGEKRSEAPAAKPVGKRVVIIGDVSTDGRKTDILPENYPQPSRVKSVLAKEGEEVKAGQPLLEFDREAYDLKVL